MFLTISLFSVLQQQQQQHPLQRPFWLRTFSHKWGGTFFPAFWKPKRGGGSFCSERPPSLENDMGRFPDPANIARLPPPQTLPSMSEALWFVTLAGFLPRQLLSGSLPWRPP